MPEIVNIAGYKFVTLDRLPERRERLVSDCKKSGLMGTILLSIEGINLTLAGTRSGIDDFLHVLRKDQAFQDFRVKESPGDRMPFNRLLVRIKKEIIAFGMDQVEPQKKTSPKLKPAELKAWLDRGMPVTLLDVRNNYEVELGTFKNATVVDIDQFKQFPDAVEKIEALKDSKPIVMFCTGGIRCEKAGPFMEDAGYDSVYQLDGGILQYFEDCGGDHYDGDCFVFDQRVAVNPGLQETDAEICFACQAVLMPEHLELDEYQPGFSCPYCFQTPEEKREALRQRRCVQVKVVTHPLPGSVPYDNYRPLNVPLRFGGFRLINFLTQYHSHVAREVWESKIDRGCILHNSESLTRDSVVREGQRLEHLLPAMIEPDVGVDIQWLYEDDFLVVINKPAPLPMHPSGRYNRNSLTWILNEIFDHPLRTAHRLDANTTGVVVFCKTRKVASIVQPQFEKQQVAKQYLALTNGVPPENKFLVDLPITDQPTIAGGRLVEPSGKQSQTQFEVQMVSENGQQALVKAIPKTGRTNQIRIHLWQNGTPIVGDPTYLPSRQMAETQTLSLNDPPMCLHAWKIGFLHPQTREPIEFVAPLPKWPIESGIKLPSDLSG